MKIKKIKHPIDENGKLIGNGYLGIGINITQDNGELIDIDELLTMEQYQTLYKSFVGLKALSKKGMCLKLSYSLSKDL